MLWECWEGDERRCERICVFAVVSGGDVDDSSPYEPVAANRQPDTFRLASISSGTAALTFTQQGGTFF